MTTPADLATAVQEYVQTLTAAISNPRDAVNVLTNLISATPQPTSVNTSSIGGQQQILSSGITDLCRRYAICQLAQAVSLYQPKSYNDAQMLRNNVCAIIDAEIDIAGDQGQDATYLALKQVRQAVVQDLTARGAALAPLTTLKFGASLPALAIAYRQYQDITRSDQLIAYSKVIHPGFMPHEFQALAQ